MSECSNVRKDLVEVDTSIPGLHNRQNAALALRMALALGCDESKARAALLSFRGVERRLQLVTPTFEHSNIRTFKHFPAVYDDYAHNPEKLHAMWTTLAGKYPKGICVIWRPHGYAPLRKMMDALATMFAETVRARDKLLLLPVYDAGGTTDRSVNSDALVEKIASLRVSRVSSVSSTSSTSSDPKDPRDSTGDSSDPRDSKDPILVADLGAAYDWCAAHRRDFGAFVTCGARDPGLPALARRLSEL